MKLRYMIIGAGGVGGPVGAYLSKSGADTTLIARGKHLAVLQEHGLTLVSGENERESIPVKAIDMDGFLAAREQGAPAPDVIFVCVKGYSLADTVPFIRKAAGKDTVVIPVLNIYGTGRTLQAELPELLVTDGCIYISANRIAPGVIQKHGAICRIVYGLPSHKTDHPVLQQVETDLKNAGIDPVYSPYVERDTLLKFAYVSPNAACGQYYHAKAAEMQHPGEVRDSFVRLIKEVVALADKMGIPLESRPGSWSSAICAFWMRLHRPRLPLCSAIWKPAVRGGWFDLSGCASGGAVRRGCAGVSQNRRGGKKTDGK